MVLQRPDHFQTGAIADVRKPGITMPTEISLQNSPILCPIEDRAPGFEFAHALRRFFGVQLGHSPLIHVLTAAHRVGEMDFPIVALVHVCERRRNPAFGHNRVCFSEQRFANKSDPNSGSRSFDRRA